MRSAGRFYFQENFFLYGRMSTRLYPICIEEVSAVRYPSSRVAAVAGDLQAFGLETFHVGFFDVLESDEAISKAPVSSVLLARTNVVEYNYNRERKMDYTTCTTLHLEIL